jgi:serine/threonine-protein kinase
VERFLAQGGCGSVYIAEQVQTELLVALKVLLPHVLHSSDAIERFKLEARIAGRVGSEHIVKVIDAGIDEASQMPFLAMELLEGSDLAQIVERQGPLDARLVVSYLTQVASALDRAHVHVDRDGVSQPIVHRDLKPENLFLCHRESGEPIIKVLDFGIAKVLGNSAHLSQEVKGTPLFMACEQASGGVITPQTDIWALGLIAFYLLTGRHYWLAAHRPDAGLVFLFGEVLAQPIIPPSARARELALANLPEGFDAWFLRCVNRDPAQRFSKAGECASALAQVLVGGRPTAALDLAARSATITIVNGAAAWRSQPPGVPASEGAVGAISEAAHNTASSIALGRTHAPKARKSTRSAWAYVALALVTATVVGFMVRGSQSHSLPSAASVPTELMAPAHPLAPTPPSPALSVVPAPPTPSDGALAARPSATAIASSHAGASVKPPRPSPATALPPAPAAVPAPTLTHMHENVYGER